jgi:hypothetical protein
MLRPEHVRVSADDPGTSGAIRVRVVERIFQGAVVRYGLEGAGGAALTAITPLADRLDEGADEAWASWSSAWAYVLPDDPAPETDDPEP